MKETEYDERTGPRTSLPAMEMMMRTPVNTQYFTIFGGIERRKAEIRESERRNVYLRQEIR